MFSLDSPLTLLAFSKLNLNHTSTPRKTVKQKTVLLGMVCEFRFRRQPDLSELINFKKRNDNLKKFKESQLNKETSEIGKSFCWMLRTLTEGWYLCCYKYRRRHLNYIQIFSWKIMWTFTLTQPVLMCLHFNGPPFPLKYKLNNWIHPMNIRCKRKILVKRNAIIELLRTLSHGSWCLQKDLISPFVDLFMLIFCWIWPFCVFGA